jgi:hypothetical protein
MNIFRGGGCPFGEFFFPRGVDGEPGTLRYQIAPARRSPLITLFSVLESYDLKE